MNRQQQGKSSLFLYYCRLIVYWLRKRNSPV
ncbi:hypothetical protein T10_5896 [Trichinella papuae]|uniref:Uncharacterized protein n=1 Tax=Trichinella papuae TaxID=268474 RepID=A0A0V1LXD2_9BILA|nr:hypothetical protein T10_5896 [Trichinella papuae]